MLIAIEGIDGSGKGTQSARLVERWNEAGHKTALLSFPQYGTTLFGRAVGDFLNGRFGSLDAVHPFLASLLYAGDRFESRNVLQQLLDTHEHVVLDRYVASNLAHQGAKCDGPARAELLDRIRTIEHEIYGMPVADRTILLDLPALQAQELIARKAARTYTEKAADLQEADGRYLARVSEVYRELAVADSHHWRIISCSDAEGIRPVDAISDDVFRAARRES
ncbi:MAG: thymidylate kinase [Planctomycetaceae bacterium]|nr:thymidylate kinase [Planctomycetaceae bacterium]